MEIRSISVTDSLGTPRTSYSSSERITLKAEVYNTEACDRINFKFIIYDPSGQKVLEHVGNSIPGTVGLGGSSVADIHISRFYKTPGMYTYEVTVSETRVPTIYIAATKKTSFYIFSPVLTLLYPSNNSKDLADNPLIFRWAGSGATKYRIYVDDDMAFYNCLFTGETTDTSYTYPTNPSDIRQRLAGGVNYYWKVEGLDAAGNAVAVTAQPFTFTIKDTAAAPLTRDIGISAIYIEPLDAENLKTKVEVKNNGSRSETNITVTLFINGAMVGTQKIDFISAAQQTTVEFLVPKPASEKFVASAAHNFIDDTAANNLLTISISLPAETFVAKGKIIGKVLEDDGTKSKDEGIGDALITYSGPVSGEVRTQKNGQYQIDDLPLGSYRIKATHPEYESQEVVVEITKNRAYPQVDFRLMRKEASALISAMSLSEFWNEIKVHIDKDVLALLEGYEITAIEGAEAGELRKIAEDIKAKRLRIERATLE